MRSQRIRPGRLAEPTQGVLIREESYNIIIDHRSASWATEENIAIHASTRPIRNITVQWTISAQGLTGDAKDDHDAGASAGTAPGAFGQPEIDDHQQARLSL